jgi:hypothetical protein
VDDVDVRHTINVNLCAVCQETFVVSESVRKLPCGHLYVLPGAMRRAMRTPL